MKKYTIEFKDVFFPVEKGIYAVTNLKWTETCNVLEFDIFIKGEYYATYSADYNNFKAALANENLAEFKIKKYKTSLPILKEFEFQYEAKKPSKRS